MAVRDCAKAFVDAGATVALGVAFSWLLGQLQGGLALVAIPYLAALVLLGLLIALAVSRIKPKRSEETR